LDFGFNFGFALLPMLVTLAFYVFIIYVLISFLRFMKIKNQLDQERNDKLNRLLHVMEQRAKDRNLAQASANQEER